MFSLQTVVVTIAVNIEHAGNGEGFVETSAETVKFYEGIDVLTDHWLIDPTNLIIDAVAAAGFSSTLNSGDVSLQTAAGGTQAGNIVLQSGATISKTSGPETTFTLLAHNDITINGDIEATGSAVLNVNLNADFDMSGGDSDVFIRNDITTNGGSLTVTAADDIDIKNGATVSTNGGAVDLTSRGTGNGSWLWMPTGGAGTGTISTAGGDVTVTVDNVNIASGSSIDAGTGDVTIQRDVAGTIGLGAASGDMELSQAEIARIDAENLNVGGANTTELNVDGVDTTSSTIVNLVSLASAGDINFNGANVFNALEAEAGDDVLVDTGASITTKTGGVSLTANNDTNDGVTVLQIEGAIDTTMAGADGDVDLNSTDYFIEVDSTGSITTDGGKLTATSNHGFDIDNGGVVSLGNGGAHIDAPKVQLGDDIDTTGPITGTASEVDVENPDAEIQDGVDVAANNATVNVAAGTYNESVDVDKTGLKLRGANAGLDGKDGSRGPETIVVPNSPAFDVNADDVTIDGFTMTGGPGDVGVLAENVDRTTIINNIITGQLGPNGPVLGDGVFLRNNDGSVVSNNWIHDLGDDGIQGNNADNVTVSDNTIENVGDAGIALIAQGGNGSDNATVTGNKVDGTVGFGIRASGTGNVVVDNNEVNNAGDPNRAFQNDAIHVDGGYTSGSVSDNKVTDVNDDAAIELDGVSGLMVADNRIDADQGAFGIKLIGSDSNTLKENRIRNVSENGIDNRDSDGTDMFGNIIRFAGGHGIYVNPSDDIRIIGNTITDIDEDGIHSEEGNDIRVRNNTIRRIGKDGIDITRNDYVRVTGNTVTDTDRRGISIERSNNDTELSVAVAGNTVRRTGRTSIVVDRFTTARIADNIVTDSNRDGIRAKRGDDVRIRRNTIRDVARDAIEVDRVDVLDVRRNTIRRAGWDGIRIRDFDNGWVAYNDIKWTGDDGIDAQNGDFISIYDNYIDLSGFLPAEFFGNEEVGEDANGIYVADVGGGDLPPLEGELEGYGTSKYGYTVEIYGNEVANSQDDGIQVEREYDEDFEEGDFANARILISEPSEDAGYTTYIADNIVGHVQDDGVDVDNYDVTIVRDNAISLTEDKGITIDGQQNGRYAGVFDNRILLTGSDGIEIENIYGGQDAQELGDDDYGYGWSVNVSGNEIAMTAKDGIEVRYSGPTKVHRNDIFMAGLGAEVIGDKGRVSEENQGPLPNTLEEVIRTINIFASETGTPPYVLLSDAESFDWNWGNGHGINVHNVGGSFYSPNGWAVDITGNTVRYTGGHGILATENDRTRIRNNTVKYAGIDQTTFNGSGSMMSMINSGPFDRSNPGRRDLWKTDGTPLITIVDEYIGRPTEEPEEPEYDNYITVSDIEFDGHDGIHAEYIYGRYEDGRSGRPYLFDLKIKGNTIDVTGDDGIEVLSAGRTLIAENTISHAGYGGPDEEESDYGAGGYFGADGIHVRDVSVEEFNEFETKVSRIGGLDDVIDMEEAEEGYPYEPRRNYALIIRNNDIRRTADDGIEVVGNGLPDDNYNDFGTANLIQGGRGDYDDDYQDGYYTTNDRVLIAENTIRRTGVVDIYDNGNDDRPAILFSESNLGHDGHGHDGIHVRGINGITVEDDFWSPGSPGEGLYQGGEEPSPEPEEGRSYYGYAVDIIDNDVRRTGDDGIEVAYSNSTLIYGNTVRRSGVGGGYYYGGADYYGADGIHVRNVGVLQERHGGGGNPWAMNAGNVGEGGYQGGEGFEPYAVVIDGNDVRRTQDDGIEVVGTQDNIMTMEQVEQFTTFISDHLDEPYDDRDDNYGYAGTGRTLIIENKVRRAGALDDGYYRYDDDGYGADGIHVRGVVNIFDRDFDDRFEDVTRRGNTAGGIYDGYNPYDIQIIGNNVKNTQDDGVEVRGARYVYTDLLVDGNKVKNSGDNGILIVSPEYKEFGDPRDTGRNSVALVSFDGGMSSDVLNNKVVNSENNGLFVSGASHDWVVVSNNKFKNNDIGAHFQSGTIDLTGKGNKFKYGRVGMRFAPVLLGYEEPYYDDYTDISARSSLMMGDPIYSYLSLIDDDGPEGYGGTIGRQTFDSQSQFYVELDNGAFFDPGQPTLLNGLESKYKNTPFGDFRPIDDFPAGFPGPVQSYMEDMFYHYVDDSTLGLFWLPLLANIGQEDIFNQFGTGLNNIAGLNVTLLGMPNVPGAPAALNNIAPAAGGNNPEDLNEIEPAAGENDPESLNEINPAAGAAEATCWADATSTADSGAPVSLNYSGDAVDLLDSEAGCGSSDV